jgi:isopenicillin-N epimerase
MSWLLDPDVAHLNHGSFGACPREILDEQSRWRARMEANPMQLFLRDLESLGDAARERLGAFVGARGEDLAFVPNATFGVNAVARTLRPGDEVLVTDHGYNACVNALAGSGARLICAQIPLPTSEDQVVDAILSAASERTRLALVDHVTSPTGLVWPMAPLVAELERRNIAVLVDGAHAPGMLPLQIEALGAAYYVGNCHKWLCAPKGAAFLWARPDKQADLRPPILSHGANATRTDRSRFRLEFDWMGTSDPTAWLSLPFAIDFFDWEKSREHNRALALEGRRILCEALGVPPLAPESMIGSLAAVALPDGDAFDLQRRLWERKIEVPIVPWPAPPRRLVRISAQLYNHADQYRELATALLHIL